jgi:hypothetical protein
VIRLKCHQPSRGNPMLEQAPNVADVEIMDEEEEVESRCLPLQV